MEREKCTEIRCDKKENDSDQHRERKREKRLRVVDRRGERVRRALHTLHRPCEAPRVVPHASKAENGKCDERKKNDE